MLLKRSSKNAPRTLSWRLASRASGSFKHFMNQLRLCRRSRAVATHLASLRRHWTHSLETGRGCLDLSRGGKSRPQRLHNFFIGPSLGDVRIEPHEDVQVVIHDREPADGYGEDFRKFFQPFFDPFFAVARPSASPSRNARRTQRVMQ